MKKSSTISSLAALILAGGMALAGFGGVGGSYGCGDDDKKSKSAASAREEADAGNDFQRPLVHDAGQYDAGQSDTSPEAPPQEPPSNGIPGDLICFDNNVYRYTGDGTSQLELVCGESTECREPGVCAPIRDRPYICETTFSLRFHKGTQGQWQHRGFYALDSLCPGDEGLFGQPVFVDQRDSLSFIAPVCTNAKALRIAVYPTVRLRYQPLEETVLLRLPGQQPHEMFLRNGNDCNPYIIATGDLEHNTDFRQIVQSGRLPVSLEFPRSGWSGGLGWRYADQDGNTYNSSWGIGISKIEIASCYPDIKDVDGRGPNTCDYPPCPEEGRRRCVDEVLEECTSRGWSFLSSCQPPNRCDDISAACLSPTEVETCEETQAIIFGQETADQWTLDLMSVYRFDNPLYLSCGVVCPQYVADRQPLLLNGDSLSTSFNMSADATKLKIDLVARGAHQGFSPHYLLLNEERREFNLEHVCEQQRFEFENPDGFGNNGRLNMTLEAGHGVRFGPDETTSGWDPNNQRCQDAGYDLAPVRLAVTACKTEVEYR